MPNVYRTNTYFPLLYEETFKEKMKRWWNYLIDSFFETCIFRSGYIKV